MSDVSAVMASEIGEAERIDFSGAVCVLIRRMHNLRRILGYIALPFAFSGKSGKMFRFLFSCIWNVADSLRKQ